MRLSIQCGHGWFRSVRTEAASTVMTGSRDWQEQRFTTLTPSFPRGGNESRETRFAQMGPGRAMVLGKWGAFVLQPNDARTTRMHSRTRGRGVPTLSGIAST